MTGGGRGDDRPTVPEGLQPERTRLSWSRTALSLGAVGALVLHTGDSIAPAAGGLALILCAVAVYLAGRVRYRSLVRAIPGAGPVVAPRAMLLVAVCSALAAPAALVDTFF